MGNVEFFLRASMMCNVDSQSPALLDHGSSMLYAYWLTDADEMYSLGIEIGHWMNDKAFFHTLYIRGDLVSALKRIE